MKLLAYTLSIVLLLTTDILMQNTVYSQQKSGDLTVVISGLKSNKGSVQIALSNSKRNFETKGAKPTRGISATIKNKKAAIVFKNLPFGEYAIKLFHDENGNGKLDTNIIGIPKEDYAFSNNARGLLGLPNYKKVRFMFRENMTIEIALSEN